jgi:hypothetical protein
MNESIEKRSVWRVLSCALLVCGSAVLFGSALFYPLGFSRDIECHQAMLANQAAHLGSVELDHGLRADLQPLIDGHGPLVDSTADGLIVVLKKHTQERVTQLEVVAEPHRDFADLIAEGHAAPNLRITAFRYRQFHIFQNQFISMLESSCLRDARRGTSGTVFSPISSPSPLVLSTYGPSTLSPRSGITEPGESARRRFTQKAA